MVLDADTYGEAVTSVNDSGANHLWGISFSSECYLSTQQRVGNVNAVSVQVIDFNVAVITCIAAPHVVLFTCLVTCPREVWGRALEDAVRSDAVAVDVNLGIGEVGFATSADL